MSTPPDTNPARSGAPSSAVAAAAPPRRNGALLAVVAVVVVAVVVLAALVLAGVGPFARPSGSNGGVAFSSARQSANSTASSHAGGFDTLVFGAGFNTRSSLTLPLSGLLTNPGCTITAAATASVDVPSTSGEAGTGSAAFWAFLYQNSSGGGLLVTVANGAASVVGTLAPGQNCAFLGNAFGAIPAGIVDSVTAANAANHEGGSGFLNAHANATGVYAVLGGSSALNPSAQTEWLVDYTLCSPLSTSGAVEPAFSAVLNGLSGDVLAAASTNTSCSGSGNMSPPLGTEFAFGSPSQISNSTGVPGCAAAGASDWCDAIPVGAAGGGLRADELDFQVETGTGIPVTFSGAAALPTLTIMSATGSMAAEYSLATSSWVSGGSVLFSTTETLILDLGCTVTGTHACNPTPTGLDLVAEGVGAVSGSVSVTLV
jgi:hypothetical protein